MSDNSFFESEQATSDVDVPANRRVLIIGGAVAGAAVLAAGGWFLLGGSGSPQLGLPPAQRHVTPAAQPTAKTVTPATKAVKPSVQLPATSRASLGRDPFLALYVQPASTGTSTPPTPGTTTTSPGGTGTTPTTQPAVTTYAMKLTRVYGSGKQLTAVFTVGSKTQLAKVGSVFGATQELKLLSLQQGTKGVWTAVVQEGDGQPFDAPTGQTMYVR